MTTPEGMSEISGLQPDAETSKIHQFAQFYSSDQARLECITFLFWIKKQKSSESLTSPLVLSV